MYPGYINPALLAYAQQPWLFAQLQQQMPQQLHSLHPLHHQQPLHSGRPLQVRIFLYIRIFHILLIIFLLLFNSKLSFSTNIHNMHRTTTILTTTIPMPILCPTTPTNLPNKTHNQILIHRVGRYKLYKYSPFAISII